MENPKELHYTKEHEWIRMEGDVAVEGITYFAQHLLTDVVFVELPAVGKLVEQGKPFMVVESVKSVSDIFAGVSGEIVEVNQAVVNDPSLVNKDPFGEGWMVKIKMKDSSEANNLMSADAYTAFCKEVHH